MANTVTSVKLDYASTAGLETLIATTEYTYACSNNINVGTNSAVVTVTGQGNFTGTATANYSIDYVFYLSPNNDWKSANARFAAALLNSSDSTIWIDLVSSGDNYKLSVSYSQKDYLYKMIFCRMDPSKSSNSFTKSDSGGPLWNQTDDLYLNEYYNGHTYTITGWNNSGNWDSRTVLILNPNSDWKSNGARFAAYFFNDSGNTWVDMTQIGTTGKYYVVIPSGYTKVIFVRMNGATSANNWDNKWNQTGNLTFDNDMYNITGWNESGNWAKAFSS